MKGQNVEKEITAQNDIVIIQDDFSNLSLELDADDTSAEIKFIVKEQTSTSEKKDTNGNSNATSKSIANSFDGNTIGIDFDFGDSSSDTKQASETLSNDDQTVIRIEDEIGIEDKIARD